MTILRPCSMQAFHGWVVRCGVQQRANRLVWILDRLGCCGFPRWPHRFIHRRGVQWGLAQIDIFGRGLCGEHGPNASPAKKVDGWNVVELEPGSDRPGIEGRL